MQTFAFVSIIGALKRMRQQPSEMKLRIPRKGKILNSIKINNNQTNFF